MNRLAELIAQGHSPDDARTMRYEELLQEDFTPDAARYVIAHEAQMGPASVPAAPEPAVEPDVDATPEVSESSLHYAARTAARVTLIATMPIVLLSPRSWRGWRKK